MPLPPIYNEFITRFFPDEEREGMRAKLRLYHFKAHDHEGMEKVCGAILREIGPNRLDPNTITTSRVYQWASQIVAITDLDMLHIPDEQKIFQIKAAGTLVRTVILCLSKEMAQTDHQKAKSVIILLHQQLTQLQKQHDRWAGRLIEELNLTRLLETQFSDSLSVSRVETSQKQITHLLWTEKQIKRDALARILKEKGCIKSQNSLIRVLPTKRLHKSPEPLYWLDDPKALIWLIGNLCQGVKWIKPVQTKGFWKMTKLYFLDKNGNPFSKNFPDIFRQMQNNPNGVNRQIVREVNDILLQIEFPIIP